MGQGGGTGMGVRDGARGGWTRGLLGSMAMVEVAAEMGLAKTWEAEWEWNLLAAKKHIDM